MTSRARDEGGNVVRIFSQSPNLGGLSDLEAAICSAIADPMFPGQPEAFLSNLGQLRDLAATLKQIDIDLVAGYLAQAENVPEIPRRLKKEARQLRRAVQLVAGLKINADFSELLGPNAGQ